jgi:hypothetical protein
VLFRSLALRRLVLLALADRRSGYASANFIYYDKLYGAINM